MEKKNLIVQLKLYKGQVNFNEGGELTSQSQFMKLHYGIREWNLFLKSIKKMGWTRVDVIKCFDGNETIEKDGVISHPVVDTPYFVENEIKDAMRVEEKNLTPEQKEIKELKEQMAELLKPKTPKAKKEATTKKDDKEDESLKLARKRYEEVIGEKPHHKKTLAGLNEEIETKLNSDK